MIVAKTIREICAAVSGARAVGKGRVGFVPTMGALHAGHFSLVEAARRECGFVVVSIFVNPTQFGPNEDFTKYPRPVEKDLAGCREHGADAVFLPEVAEMYGEGLLTTVRVGRMTERLCGASRPGHFDGVCTVVTKLFNIVGADVAYFGAKDYQQAAVIGRMVADLNQPVEIKVCPTVRESDGLAMSSRNVYLKPDERRQATALIESLRLAEKLIGQGERAAAAVTAAMRSCIREKAPLGAVDYIEIVDPDDLSPVEAIARLVVIALAVKFPSARLIDNMRVDVPRQS